jgi:hypothetical protein
MWAKARVALNSFSCLPAPDAAEHLQRLIGRNVARKVGHSRHQHLSITLDQQPSFVFRVYHRMGRGLGVLSVPSLALGSMPALLTRLGSTGHLPVAYWWIGGEETVTLGTAVVLELRPGMVPGSKGAATFFARLPDHIRTSFISLLTRGGSFLESRGGSFLESV